MFRVRQTPFFLENALKKKTTDRSRRSLVGSVLAY